MRTENTHYTLATILDVGNTILNVENISALQKFYYSGVGLEILNKDANEIVLGKDTKKIITLSSSPELPYAPRTSAGLYHNAIVFKSRGQLANTIKRMFHDYPGSFIGSADHFVSEAFYFVDPEGNELELYYDKDRSLWEWNNGRVKMGLEYIDPAEYINTYSSHDDSDEKHMGHVHLKVGDIPTAKDFYVDTVGFDITAELPQALFVSVGGYHHHIGMNTWQSYGASPRAHTLGLKSIELNLPGKSEMDALADRLESAKVAISHKQDAFNFSDPWNNIVNVHSM